MVLCLALAGAASAARAEEPDARFLEGLRQRRLFELAEEHCRDRLGRVARGTPKHAELTAELIRTYAVQAVNSPPHQREPLWTRAHSTSADFLRQSPTHPRATIVRLQDALARLAQGELGRQEFEAGALPADGMEPIRQALREATNLLESLDKELTRELPLRRRTPPAPGGLSADDLANLVEQVRHQLARAQRNRALLFERGSDDRLALLLAAVETLERLITELTDEQPLKAATQLDLAECQRLLGRSAEAAELAAAVDREGVRPSDRLRARAELIRVALAQKNLPAAHGLLTENRTLGGESSPELDFARFEALLALATSAGEGQRPLPNDDTPPAELARRFQEQAAEAASLLETSHGSYWGRRADQWLVAALPRGETIANVELLSRRAESFYLRGELNQAIATYDDAAAQARTKGDNAVTFDLAYKAALIEQGRGAHGAAATRLRELAKSDKLHPQAAAAHLLAAWNAAQQVRAANAPAETYGELLHEHLAVWPAAKSADQARMWLGTLCYERRDWTGAIEAYSAVPRGSRHFTAAITELAGCWRHRLAALAADGQPTEGAALAAIRFFRQVTVGSDNRWPEKWIDADRAAALAAAEFIVAHQPGSISDAEDILRRAIAGSPDAPAAWLAAARAQLVVAIAGQGGRQHDAVAELQAIGIASPREMLDVLDGLSQLAARGSDRSRAEIAGVQLAAVAALSASREQRAGAEQLALDRVHAEALAAAGRREEALVAYARLARENPESGAVQVGYAALLLSSNDPAQLKQSLEQWRIVASHSQPRTGRWYRAKYSVALAQYKLGDRAGAAKLLRFLLETPPGLKGHEWEARYLELLKKCSE